MEMKKLFKYIGMGLGITALVANIQYALLDYGMHDNSLGYQLLAQTNGTGGSSGGNTGGNTGGSTGGSSSGGETGGSSNGSASNSLAVFIRTDYDCKYTFKGKAGATITIFGGKVITIGADGTAEYTYGSGKTDCSTGGTQFCVARYCPQL